MWCTKVYIFKINLNRPVESSTVKSHVRNKLVEFLEKVFSSPTWKNGINFKTGKPKKLSEKKKNFSNILPALKCHYNPSNQKALALGRILKKRTDSLKSESDHSLCFIRKFGRLRYGAGNTSSRSWIKKKIKQKVKKKNLEQKNERCRGVGGLK